MDHEDRPIAKRHAFDENVFAVVQGKKRWPANGCRLAGAGITESKFRGNGGNARIFFQLERLFLGDRLPPRRAVSDKFTFASQRDVFAMIVADESRTALPSELKTEGA